MSVRRFVNAHTTVLMRLAAHSWSALAKHDRGILGECIGEERKSPFPLERHACEPRGAACVDVLTVSVSVEVTAKFRSRDCAR